MKTLTNSFFFSCFCLLVSSLSHAESGHPTSEPLVIGAALHLTGDYADYGEAFRRGIELAYEEIQAAGGISGRPLRVIFEDTGYDMQKLHSITQKFITLDHIDAMIISNYTEVMRVGHLLERSKVPTITVWDSSPEIEQLGTYIFGLGIWTPDSAEKIARFAAREQGAKRAAIVSTEGEWSIKAAQYFSTEFIKDGGEIIKSFTVAPQDSDFRSLLTMLRVHKPDVVYAPVANNISAFFSQYAAARLGIPVVTSDVLTEEIVAQLGARADGITQAQGGDAAGPLRSHLLELHRKRYGEECGKVLFVALGYDSLRVLVEAARREPTATRESITSELYKIKSFPGAAAEITINEAGSSRLPATLVEARGGKIIPVQSAAGTR